jgi:DNA polymerase III delta subunit-like protein
MTMNSATPSEPTSSATQATATIYLVSRSVDRLSEGRHLAASVVDACESDTSKIVRGIHPDVIELSPPEGKERIGIGQVRDIIRSAQFAPVQSACKVCLIAKAEALTIEASNALLKILEEPPRGLRFILLAEHPSDLLPTIVSRSRIIRVPIAAASKIVDRLVAASYDENTAQWIARLSLRDGELEDLLAPPVDVAQLLVSSSAGFATADIGAIITTSVSGNAILRRQGLLAILNRIAVCDGELLTVGVRILATQTRESLAQFFHDLLAVSFDLVRSAGRPLAVSDPLAEQVHAAFNITRLHEFCFALDEAHRSLVVYGPVEGILLSLFLTPEGDAHDS